MSIASESAHADLSDFASRHPGRERPQGELLDTRGRSRDVFTGQSSSADEIEHVGQVGRRRAHRRLRDRLLVPLVDSIVVVMAVMCAQFGRFGFDHGSGPHSGSAWFGITLYSIALAVIWVTAIGMQRSWDLSLVGVGVEEYRRVLTATGWVFGVVATADLVLQLQMARGYLIIALPVGVLGLLLGRRRVRHHVAKKRLQGKLTNQMVVLGNPDSVLALSHSVDRAKSAGYRIAGACVPGFGGPVGSTLRTLSGSQIPIFGDENAVEAALRATNADAFAVAAVEHLGLQRMRKLAWHLDELGVDMIVMPGMTDIAGPRLKVRPIDNLPLFHIARPRRDTMSLYRKRAFDLAVGFAALLVMLPLMVGAALAIKLNDDGPVFFRQERVGLHGKRFKIFKFRTMYVDAHLSIDSERQVSEQAEGVFYKSASDSRVTCVGRFLRKTSIDELPQLLNVLAGTMSIVGPRPLVPGEGASVEHFVRRRSLVKPGMTGLWQVSGRSDVSAEERIRLDHSYVDNWSSIQDLVIVWRTARAVVKRSGAY